MNKYDDEATQYQNPDDEATQFENSTSGQAGNETTASQKDSQKESKNDEVKVKAAKGGTWKRAAVGAGSGLLIGGVATFLMGMKAAPHDDGNHKDELSNPEWVDDDIAVATTVNDDMSFGEAFAAARAEVGPGGCFEWHGNIYGTYTADEWNHMTAEERTDWSDHFSWNHIDRSRSDVAQHSTTTRHASSDATEQAVEDDDDIDVVYVDKYVSDENDIYQEDQVDHVYHASDEDEINIVEPEIEILGVTHDYETDANIAGMSIDGQDVILIDVDNDLAFDYMAGDANGNGQIEHNEIADIQDQNLTVNDLGGFSGPTTDSYADGNDIIDYSDDMMYDA